jgi:hypothetical protein
MIRLRILNHLDKWWQVTSTPTVTPYSGAETPAQLWKCMQRSGAQPMSHAGTFQKLYKT